MTTKKNGKEKKPVKITPKDIATARAVTKLRNSKGVSIR